MSDTAIKASGLCARTLLGNTVRYSLIFLLGGLAGALPFYVNDYIQYILNTIVIYCLVSLGFNIVIGYLGQLAFANAAFFGIGAYAAGLVMVHFDVPFPLALCLASLAGAAAGCVVGLVALRLSGYYLIVTTFAFIEFMRWLYIHGGAVTFGSSGFNVPEARIAGLVVDSEREKYFVFMAMAAAVIWATSRLIRSHFGRSIVAIRNNEKAAAAAGVPVVRTKVIAFVWSGFIVGIAGALYAILIGRVTPDSFGLDQMLTHFVSVMVGGLGSITGSLLGALVLTSLPELLRNFTGLEEILYSLLLIFVLFLMPKGISGRIAERIPALREGLYRASSNA